jgi:hypothetical protein
VTSLNLTVVSSALSLAVPKSVLGINNLTSAASSILRDNTSKSEDDTESVKSGSSSDKTPTKPDLTIDTSTPIPDFVEEYDEIDAYTNHPLVERAFEECDLNHEGRLKYEEFKM